MNFVFISPHFPHTYWQFCQRLSQNGVRVLAIADVHYDLLQPELKESLTEYYRVDSLENYDEVYRGVAYFAYELTDKSPKAWIVTKRLDLTR
jgi:hypothetical protein